jgi:hypothetical protein
LIIYCYRQYRLKRCRIIFCNSKVTVNILLVPITTDVYILIFTKTLGETEE